MTSLLQAVVTHQGYGCITPPVSGGMMQGLWSWASFILLSWPSLLNNTPSTSVDTAPPSVPRLCVYKHLHHLLHYLWFKRYTGWTWDATYFKSFSLHGTDILVGTWPFCLLVYIGFATGRNLYICITAAHPPGRPWGEDSFGEGRQGAGGGPGGPALQHSLPGE